MITILGSTGMLGSMVSNVFGADSRVLNRPYFDAERYTGGLQGQVINCIGVIKPYCDDVERAIKVNALFPHRLPEGTIQIATDCVFSGKKGHYVETDEHDAIDVYGKTKSLGEAPYLINLRCSVIGPEKNNHLSLLDWFLAQEGEVEGYTNHLWNGITTLHFAKIVQGIIKENRQLPQLQHIVPADSVTKAELLTIIANAYGKKTKVRPVEAPEAVDRTLDTLNPDVNLRLWQAAGYRSPPTIKQMVQELAACSR